MLETACWLIGGGFFVIAAAFLGGRSLLERGW